MTPGDPQIDRWLMAMVLCTVLGGAVLMAGAGVVFLMMTTHF